LPTFIFYSLIAALVAPASACGFLSEAAQTPQAEARATKIHATRSVLSSQRRMSALMTSARVEVQAKLRFLL